MHDDAHFIHRAYLQAVKSAGEGGVPVGACLAHGGVLVAEGHNRRQQEKTIILHGETDCLRQAGLFGLWHEATLYTTLSPCMMCAGTIVQFRIPRVVIADATNFGGNEAFLRDRGVDVVLQEYAPMVAFFARWKEKNPDIWNGDIGL
ncbi:MAG: nucleoside deaminase [Rhodobacteraceae bacterium]|nr:nucleoside deaminase [Paracoccaceae bacterium]